MADSNDWDRMVSGEWYCTHSPALVPLRKQAKNLCERLQVEDSLQRQRTLTSLLPNARDGHIGPGFWCDYGLNIHGNGRFTAGENVVILDAAMVIIGDNVVLEDGVTIATVTHHENASKRLQGWQQALPIHIGNNVLVGAGACILPGSDIPDNTVVPHGATVRG